MLCIGPKRRLQRESGQSLIETAVMLPLLLIIAFNAINFGYAFFVAINMAAAPRTGVEYSIQGFETPTQPDLPPASTVSTLTYGDLTGVLPNSATTPQQVCSSILGVTGSGVNQVAVCTTFNLGSGSAFPAVPPDPEAPKFVLHRVYVRYVPAPLIPGQVFNVLPTLTFNRQVSMRAMN